MAVRRGPPIFDPSPDDVSDGVDDGGVRRYDRAMVSEMSKPTGEYDLTPEQEEQIIEGAAQADRGEVVSHEEVMAALRALSKHP